MYRSAHHIPSMCALVRMSENAEYDTCNCESIDSSQLQKHARIRRARARCISQLWLFSAGSQRLRHLEDDVVIARQLEAPAGGEAVLRIGLPCIMRWVGPRPPNEDYISFRWGRSKVARSKIVPGAHPAREPESRSGSLKYSTKQK